MPKHFLCGSSILQHPLTFITQRELWHKCAPRRGDTREPQQQRVITSPTLTIFQYTNQLALQDP
jgi:hypothetical protein